MLALVAQFRDLEARVRDLSGSKRAKFRKRGQLLPRERVGALLDPGAPFIELSTLAGLGMHDDDGESTVMGGGAITGIGWVNGVRCVVSASDSAIKGGTVSPMGLKKQLRALEIALEQKLPLVNLIESGGANLQYQSDLFVDGGRVFYMLARLSAAGVPTVTVVHGSSTAGGAYIPGMSDYVVLVKDRAKVFLAGPPLLLAATGEVATEEDLGGATMHTGVSGVGEYLAESDADGVRIAREIMGKLRWNDHLPARAERTWEPPRHDPDELCGVVPTDYKKPVDVREIVARIVDASDFLEFKARYGSMTVCGHAEIEGLACGIIGNNGPIDVEGAAKAGQFIQLCGQSGTPLIFLQNTTGFMVGTAQERAGIVKHGAKMIQAVANVDVPKITIHVGASFGAGNYGMCGRAYSPDFVFAWPNNRIAVMGGEQAAQVMKIVMTQKLARMGSEPDADFMDGMAQVLIDQFDRESQALFATARIWDDGLIDPRDTRRVLAGCLSVCDEARRRPVRPNSYGVARL
jgi:geranyl-CoA carboxylase beta subunit